MPELEAPQPPPEFIDAKELARRLGVSRSQIYHQADVGNWPEHRIGTLRRFNWARILEITSAPQKK